MLCARRILRCKTQTQHKQQYKHIRKIKAHYEKEQGRKERGGREGRR